MLRTGQLGPGFWGQTVGPWCPTVRGQTFRGPFCREPLQTELRSPLSLLLDQPYQLRVTISTATHTFGELTCAWIPGEKKQEKIIFPTFPLFLSTWQPAQGSFPALPPPSTAWSPPPWSSSWWSLSPISASAWTGCSPHCRPTPPASRTPALHAPLQTLKYFVKQENLKILVVPQQTIACTLGNPRRKQTVRNVTLTNIPKKSHGNWIMNGKYADKYESWLSNINISSVQSPFPCVLGPGEIRLDLTHVDNVTFFIAFIGPRCLWSDLWVSVRL